MMLSYQKKDIDWLSTKVLNMQYIIYAYVKLIFPTPYFSYRNTPFENS